VAFTGRKLCEVSLW